MTTPPVPFVTIDRENANLADDLRAAYERTVASGGFTLGPDVPAFEAEFAAYCGTDHCVGVASGTAAIAIAMHVAGVGPGDEVIVPAHTFIASALGVAHAGGMPVFCDVDEATGLLDPDAVAAAITERTSAIVAVHLYGQMCDMDALTQIARERGLTLIEDAAQAHGARWRGRPAGSLGDIGCFSFYPSKNLGGLGDGGAICTGDEAMADQARAWRNLGQLRKGEHQVAGYNERLDGLQAAFLRAKLPHLDARNEARRALAEVYRSELAGAVVMQEERAESESVHHLFPIRVPNRDELAAGLAAGGVATGVHYGTAVPDHHPFRYHRTVGEVPNARAWAAEELSLPMGAELTEDEVRRAAAAVLALTVSASVG